VQGQLLDLVRSTIHATNAVHQDAAARRTSTLQHATNVKYALSTFLQDRRTNCDVPGAPPVTFCAAPRVTPAQKL